MDPIAAEWLAQSIYQSSRGERSRIPDTDYNLHPDQSSSDVVEMQIADEAIARVPRLTVWHTKVHRTEHINAEVIGPFGVS